MNLGEADDDFNYVGRYSQFAQIDDMKTAPHTQFSQELVDGDNFDDI